AHCPPAAAARPLPHPSPLSECARGRRGRANLAISPLVTPPSRPYVASDVHSIAFHVGSLEIHWYGILVMIGFVTGLWTAGRRGVRDGFSPEVFQDLGIWLIVGTILGARVLYVVSYWKESFAGRPWIEIFEVWKGGLVFYGG